MKVILKIFTHLLSADKMVTASAKHDGKKEHDGKGTKDISAEDQYRHWLQERYNDCIKCLCRLLETDSAHVQVCKEITFPTPFQICTSDESVATV